MISDLESNFKKSAESRYITSKIPYFNVSSKEILFLFNPPHLLNAIKNNFFNYRFKSGNKIQDEMYLKPFYDLYKSQVNRLAPKLIYI